jgi:hypothetical protein
MPLRPIFIMGDHRSGTTLLYKLLVETGCFNFVSAYHVIQYNEILYNFIHQREAQAKQTLSEKLKALSIGDRAIDQVIATPDLPEEYGFIFKQFGYEPYLTLETQPILLELCQKIQFLSPSSKPLLLKNPWDFRQFMEVYQAFPNAHFIFLHRHPIHTLSSKVKALRILLTVKDPYMAMLLPWYDQFFNSRLQQLLYRLLYSEKLGLDLYQTSRQAVKTTNYFVKNIPKIPQTQYISIGYEDLCETPRLIMARIFDFLKLQEIDTPYEDFIQPRPLALLPEITHQYQKLKQNLSLYMKFHNYE